MYILHYFFISFITINGLQNHSQLVDLWGPKCTKTPAVSRSARSRSHREGVAAWDDADPTFGVLVNRVTSDVNR